MNPQVLLELVKKWESKAESPECEDGSEEATIGNAIARGERSQLRKCAEDLNLLVKLLSH